MAKPKLPALISIKAERALGAKLKLKKYTEREISDTILKMYKLHPDELTRLEESPFCTMFEKHLIAIFKKGEKRGSTKSMIDILNFALNKQPVVINVNQTLGVKDVTPGAAVDAVEAARIYQAFITQS